MAEIKLSGRMQAVADMVGDVKRNTTNNENIQNAAAAYNGSVADIGCDHAFISIYLKKKGIAGKVIAMDVKDGPLDIARANIANFGLSNYIDVRSSDGFAALEVGEADTAIIAGMGGLLIVDILAKGRCHTDAGIELILQPQSEIDKVRAYLRSISYKIIDEEMLIEDGKYYSIIKARQDEDAAEKNMDATVQDEDAAEKDMDATVQDENAAEKDMDVVGQDEDLIIKDRFGPVLLERRNEVLKSYIEEQLIKNRELMNKLSYVRTPKSEKRIEELEEELRLLGKAFSFFEV